MVSVTEILDYYVERPLVDWMLRDPKKAKQVSEEALRIGSTVDKLIQEDFRQRIPQLGLGEDPTIQRCLEGWNMFIIAHPEFYDSVTDVQTELVHEDLIGHPDFLRHLPTNTGQWGIDDLKCATQLRPSHFVQLGGYAWLIQQSQPARPRPSWLGIVRLDKERPTYDYLQLTKPADIDLAIAAFCHYRAMYQMRETVKHWVTTAKEDMVYGLS